MEQFLQYIEKILGFIKNYGFINILKSCIVIIMFAITMMVAFRPKEMISEIIQLTEVVKSDNFKEDNEIRSAINPIINSLLDRAIIDMDCDNVFVIEGHNGKSNREGLGFYYADMTYERSRNLDQATTMYWGFRDLPTSIFSIFDYLDKNRYFYGTTENVYQIDHNFARKLQDNKIVFIVLVEIPGNESVNRAVGILGYGFEKMPKISQEQIKNYMLDMRYKLHKLLTVSSLNEIKMIKLD